MRHYLIIAFLAFPFIVLAQHFDYDDFIQVTPESVWTDANKRPWYNSGYGTCTFNFNGLLYVFNYQDNGIYNGAYPYLYIMNRSHDAGPLSDYKIGPTHKNRIDNFDYLGESGSYYRPPMLGRNFAFQFNSRLWYFQQVKCSFTDSDHWTPPDESYQCFAQMPTDTNQLCDSYYIKDAGSPEILKYGAFQFDSCLYFLGVNNKSTSTNYKKWVIQEYTYNETTNTFSHHTDFYMPAIKGDMLGGIIRRIDLQGNEYMVVNTFSIDHYAYLFKLVHVLGAEFEHHPIYYHDGNNVYETCPFTATAASTIAEGSVKGYKAADKNQTLPDRMVRFQINRDPNSSGIHNIGYEEWVFEDDSAWIANIGEVILPTANAPYTAGGFYQILGTFEVVPKDYSKTLDGIDGYQQYIWFLYPNKDHHFTGAQFLSDKWALDPDSVVISLDLDRDDLYDDIKDLWSLVGIVEGAPPVSVNWHQWDETFPNPIPPSSLEFEQTSSTQVKVANSTENQWSVGQSVEVSKSLMKKLTGSLGEEFKYSQTWKNTVSYGTDTSITITQPFELFEENQDYGAFIYTVPQIKRYKYALYPWWDTDALKYPVQNSIQYLFKTIGITQAIRSMPLHGFPFYVEEPNRDSMINWLYTNRDSLRIYIENNDVDASMQLSWDSPFNGNKKALEAAADSASSYKNTSTYDIKITAGFEYEQPDVFKIKTTYSTGWEGTYSTETVTKTEFKQQVSASLANLVSTSDGLNISHLHMDVYLLRPETDSNYWFYDSLKGCKPWYLAYMVTSSREILQQLAPGNGSMLEESEFLFSWNAKDGDLGNYTFYILNSPDISGENIIYKESAGERTQLNLTAFRPDKGMTCYWAVRGFNASGEPVWSGSRAFIMKEEQDLQEPFEIKAVVYPNPGSSSDICIAVDPEAAGKISVQLININGIIVAEKEISNQDGLPATIAFPGPDMPAGIYFAVIRAGAEQVVRKVVIR